ncbi:unnamed protein product [Laminaria digitata]
MVKRLWQATNEYPPLPPRDPCRTETPPHPVHPVTPSSAPLITVHCAHTHIHLHPRLSLTLSELHPHFGDNSLGIRVGMYFAPLHPPIRALLDPPPPLHVCTVVSPPPHSSASSRTPPDGETGRGEDR